MLCHKINKINLIKHKSYAEISYLITYNFLNLVEYSIAFC